MLIGLAVRYWETLGRVSRIGDGEHFWGSSMGREEFLISEYHAARKRWLADHPGQMDPRFWELDFSFDPADLSHRACRLGEAVEGRADFDSMQAVLLLFALLRTRLSSVRINRLWPEVARVLSAQHLTVDPGRCGSFFRDVLDRAYWASIPNVHNRFVACCLEETGVGSDRAEVMSSFLSFMLPSLLEEHGSDSPQATVRRIVQRHLELRQDRDEIEVYRTHLEQTGATIAELIHDLQAEEMFADLGFWNWDQLCNWWRSYSGNDLNRLTPETRQVLESLLSGWSDRVSRRSVVRFIHRTGARLTIAGNLDQPFGSAVGELPLGPARLGVGSNAREVQLCDELGLTPDKILRYTADHWHSLGNDGIFAWSRQAFLVDRGDGDRKPSRPFFTGRTIAETRRVGDYWSGRLEHGIIPRAVDREFKSSLTPKLQLKTRWVITDGGFQLQLLGWKVLFLQGDQIVRLSIDGDVKWSGVLSENLCVEKSSPVIHRPRTEADPHLTLTDASGKHLCAIEVPRPWCNGAFLALNGEMQERSAVGFLPKSVDANAPITEGIIVGTSDRIPPHVTGGDVQPLAVDIPGCRQRLYRVNLQSEFSSAIVVATASQRWELLDTRPVELLDDECLFRLPNDIQVVATERIKPVGWDDPLRLRLPATWLLDGTAGIASFRLVVQTSTARLRWSAEDIVRIASNGEAGIHRTVSLQSLAAQSQSSLPSGLLRIHVNRRLIGRSEDVCLFRCPANCELLPGRVEEYASLKLGADGRTQHLVRSLKRVTVKDLREKRRVEGWLDCGVDGAVGFNWLPQICDVGLFRGDELIAEDRLLTIADLVETLELEALGNSDTAWLVTCGTLELILRNGERINLVTLLAERASKADGLSRDVLLQVQKKVNDRLNDEPSGPARAWRFDLAPRDLKCRSQWAGSERGWQLDVILEWQGLPTSEIRVDILDSDGLLLASSSAGFQQTESSVSRSFLSQELSLAMPIDPIASFFMNRSEPGFLELRWGEDLIQRSRLEAIPEGLAHFRLVIDPKAAIREVFEKLGSVDGRDDERLCQIVMLCERCLREAELRPIPNLDGLISRIAGKGSDTCRQQATACLRLLKIIIASPPKPICESYFAEPGPLQLLLSTLIAIHQRRLFGFGQAAPNLIFSVVANLDLLAQHGETLSRKCWASIVAMWCREWAATTCKFPATANSFDSETILAVKADPFVGIDVNLNRWLADL